MMKWDACFRCLDQELAGKLNFQIDITETRQKRLLASNYHLSHFVLFDYRMPQKFERLSKVSREQTDLEVRFS